MTTPKLPPPPRTAQKRSGCSSALAVTKRAVGQDHVHLEQVVDGEAALARQVAEAAAEGEAADAGGGDDAAGGRQAEGVGGVVDVAPGAPPSTRTVRAVGSTRTPFIGAEVDHQPVVADAEAGAVVPAAADGDEEALVAGEVDGGDDVRRRRRSGRSGRACGRSSRCRPRGRRRSPRRRGR